MMFPNNVDPVGFSPIGLELAVSTQNGFITPGLPFSVTLRSKGLTEQGLAGLGYKDLIVFRPGLLQEANREEPKPVETLYGYVYFFMR